MIHFPRFLPSLQPVHQEPTPPPPPPEPPKPVEAAPGEQSTFQPAPPTAASTLRTEQLGDGRSNCLEKAVALARPGDSIILMRDSKDGVGHALVRRPDGSVVDPNHPAVRYETLGQWQAMHPRYGQPVSVPAAQVKQVLSTPPGEKRDALIQQLGLTGVANRQVADEDPRWATTTNLDGTNFRNAPVKGDDTFIASLDAGMRLRVLGLSNDGEWLNVQLPDGRVGWVNGDVVDKTQAPPPRFPDHLVRGTRPPDVPPHTWNTLTPEDRAALIQAEREKAVAADWPPPEFDANKPPFSIDALEWSHLPEEAKRTVFQQQVIPLWQAAVREQTNLLFNPNGLPVGGTRLDAPFLGVDSEWGQGQVGSWKEYAVQVGSAAQYFNVNKVFGEGGWSTEHYNLCGPLAVGASADLTPKLALSEFKDTNGAATANVLASNLETDGSQLIRMYGHIGWEATYTRKESSPSSPEEFAGLLADGKQLVTLVNIDTDGAGGMLRNRDSSTKAVAHWVNVLSVEGTAHGEWMVRVYNPFENREEVYSWEEFKTSWGNTDGGDPYGMLVATPPPPPSPFSPPQMTK